MTRWYIAASRLERVLNVWQSMDTMRLRCWVKDVYKRQYVERAKGGAAAVTVSQNVDPNSQMSFKYVLGFEPRNKDNFKRLADEVHEYGCKAITQLNQGGHTTLMNPPQLLVAPTQMNEPYCHFNTKELEKEDMELIKEYYVNSAAWQKELGWDAVELKIAHDGLLRTFVSPFFNRREDEYGGSFENRMRYPLEVIAAIREAVGPDYPIGIRLCVDEFTWYGSVSYTHLDVYKRQVLLSVASDASLCDV